jgi:hypothetical protein
MKEMRLLCIALCLNTGMFAQNVNWLHPSDRWNFHIQSGWVGSGIEQLWLAGYDTIVAGKTYRIVERKAEFSPSGVVHQSRRLARQEGKRIYALPFSGGPEIKLYDFGLAVGDSVTLPLEFSGSSIRYIVTGISSVSIGGQTRLRQEVKWVSNGTYLSAQKGTFIEGIGAVENLHLIAGEWCLTDSYFFVDEPGSVVVDGESRTFCSFQNNQFEYEGTGETLCAVLSTDSPFDAGLSVFPNPSRGTLFVRSDSGQKIIQADLYDVAGRLIESIPVGDSAEITTNFKGMASVVVRSESGLAQRWVCFW